MAESMDYIDEQVDESTLVKYNNPVLVIKNPEKQLDSVANLKIQKQEREGRPNSGGITADNRKETEEILNDILPPRCWEEDGQLWTQTVSSVPATRQDVSNLQEMLDTRLQQTQARETGICPVRRELYRQCFVFSHQKLVCTFLKHIEKAACFAGERNMKLSADEIIRQVTINCAERGFLLSRIRDEIAMSMEAYETLYCSSAAFGIRKALQSQEGKEQLYQKVLDLQIEGDAMKNEMKDMEHKAEQTERRNNEMKLSEERKHAEEVAFLKKTNAQLKSQLEGIIAPKK